MSDSGMTVKPAVAATPPAVNALPAAAPAGKTPAVQATVEPKQAPPPSVDIEAVAKQLENFLKRVSRELEFHVDGSSGRVVCSVRDSQTGDLIRQIPNEEVLRLAELAHDETIVLLSERA
jgi:flagellar protein FlaG